jgi:hypothetical protein
MQWVVPMVLPDSVSIIGAYAATQQCAVCEQWLVARPYQCWVQEHLASYDVVPLLVGACSLQCVMRLKRLRYNPHTQSHVVFEAVDATGKPITRS